MIRNPPPVNAPINNETLRQLIQSVYYLWDAVNRTQWTIGETTIYTGTGTPENNQAGNVGDLFLRTDGGASTSIYVKESGTGDTGWTAK